MIAIVQLLPHPPGPLVQVRGKPHIQHRGPKNNGRYG